MQTKTSPKAGERTHTSGKWSVVELNGKTFVTAKPFPELEGSIQICEITRLKMRSASNAKLIAAAPDMQAALKSCLSCMEALTDSKYDNAKKTARAAIKKSLNKH